MAFHASSPRFRLIPAKSLIYKYFTCKSLFLKDLVPAGRQVFDSKRPRPEGSRSPQPAASPNFLSQLDYNSRMTKPSAKDPLVSLARYSEIGFIIPAAVLLGFFLGKLADYWLHTKWLYLVGLLFGAVVGFWQVIVMAMAAFKNDE